MTGIFDNATSVVINNKTVKSIEIGNATLFEAQPSTDITITNYYAGSLAGSSQAPYDTLTINGETYNISNDGEVSIQGIPYGEYEVSCTVYLETYDTDNPYNAVECKMDGNSDNTITVDADHTTFSISWVPADIEY